MQTLFQLLRTWWGIDRVRVSPCEGRVASLRRGQRFVVGSRLFEVLEQSARIDAAMAKVRLLLTEIDGHHISSAEMQFDISDSGSAGNEVLLKSASGDLLISDHDIVCIS